MRRFWMIIIAMLPSLASAAEPLPWATKQEDIARVEAYLTNLTTIVADFNQADANGHMSEGKFYLKRPGKMRWQYKPPTPILLVSDGQVLTYFDSELDQINYVPLGDTLAGFLAAPQIKLNSDAVKLTKFESANQMIRATVVQADKPDEGGLTLELTDAPLQLRQMVVTDTTGQRTQIQLQNAQFGTDLPDSLFVFEDPRGIQARRRRGGR